MKQPLDRLASRKKPTTRRVPIALDSEVYDAFAAAEAAVAQHREKLAGIRRLATLQPTEVNIADETAANAELDQLLEAYNHAKADLESNCAWFVARSIGPNRFDALQTDHPATEDQQEKHKAGGGDGTLGWDPDVFPKALLVASVQYVDPETGAMVDLTEEFVDDLYDGDKWNLSEVMALFQAAYEVNSIRRVVDLGKGSRQTLSSSKS